MAKAARSMLPAPRLVDVLIDDFHLHRDTILRAAANYYDSREIKLGEYLVERGLITQVQLDQALAKQAFARGDMEAANKWLAEADSVIHRLRVKHAETLAAITLQHAAALKGAR